LAGDDFIDIIVRVKSNSKNEVEMEDPVATLIGSLTI
jgi:hypothetical protein